MRSLPERVRTGTNFDKNWPVCFVIAVFLALFGTSCAEEVELVPGLHAPPSAKVLYGFSFINFTFRTSDESNSYFDNKYYESCALAGVKVSHNGDVFVSVPRWKPGVPATLSKLVTRNYGNQEMVLFDPYPSWEMNAIGVSSALQSVLGFEIELSDSHNFIWILDQGVVTSQRAIDGAIKLVVWDIDANILIRSYSFPPSIASPVRSFLNDLVLDVGKHIAYITDSGIPTQQAGTTDLEGGLIIYDFDRNVSRRVLDSVFSVQDDPSLWFSINGDRVLPNERMRTGADGIALSYDRATLYFCPLTSHITYSIPTRALLNESLSTESLNNSISVTLDKGSTTDGMAIANNSVLYISMLEKNGVAAYDPATGQSSMLVSNNNDMVWVDTFGFDHQGSLVFTTNHLNHFISGNMSFTSGQINFRIWSVFINAGSYMDTPSSVPYVPSKPTSPSVLPGYAIALLVVFFLVVAAAIGYGVYKWRQKKPMTDEQLSNVYPDESFEYAQM